MQQGTIEEIKVFPVEIPLAQPFKTSVAVQRSGRFVIVEVRGEGLSGFGEADPRPHITGETMESTVSVLKEYLIPAVVGKSFFNLEDIHQAMNVVELNPSAKNAVDIAVFDLLGKALDVPLYGLMGGTEKKAITLNAWSGIEDQPDKIVDTLMRQFNQGFNRAAKIKAGQDYSRECAALKRLASELPRDMDIIVDVNQAWEFIPAKKRLTELADIGVTIVEQPIHKGDLAGMQSLTKSAPVAVMADESVWSAQDAFRLARARAANMFNLKLIKCGGLHQARKFLGVAESADIRCMVGSTLQTSISAAAQAHLAAASHVIDLADIAIPGEFLITDMAEGFHVENGRVVFSEKPGLGLEVDRRLLERFCVS